MKHHSMGTRYVEHDLDQALERHRNYLRHKNSLRKIHSSIDNKLVNYTKLMRPKVHDPDKDPEIKRRNRDLFEKLVKIGQGKKTAVPQKREEKSPKSLNHVSRRLEENKIQKENEALARRLIGNKGGTYSRKELDDRYQFLKRCRDIRQKATRVSPDEYARAKHRSHHNRSIGDIKESPLPLEEQNSFSGAGGKKKYSSSTRNIGSVSSLDINDRVLSMSYYEKAKTSSNNNRANSSLVVGRKTDSISPTAKLMRNHQPRINDYRGIAKSKINLNTGGLLDQKRRELETELNKKSKEESPVIRSDRDR
eukprot:CAMPEP_0115032532 /NCGR_PEP_ID=MMETSP0216-20121206/39220_1 /TAXON_ID=223996 /ORGANISM="Protocruzia adherens, Strain Boccale" /LENGTH=307 /DNA_ID=CAMNT_0002410461 /DNA_START=51 /DNA_END=974 /DNA_ORIENTATION=-